MSGSIAIRHLLANKATLTAVVPAARIVVAASLPTGTALPAINVSQISSVEVLTVAMTESKRLRSDRVQVMAHASTPAQLRQILNLIRTACPDTKGTVNGIKLDSILPDLEGPDLSQPDAAIYSMSRDFFVRWIASA